MPLTRPIATRPIALTIAGSDSSGGAGIQADLKTFSALGVYGASVITAITAQNTTGVQGVYALPQEAITAQMASVASDLRIGAAKTGMLGDTATVMTVVRALETWRIGPLVVDPVMVATSGDVLLAPDAIEAVRRTLIPVAAVITPNLHEAAKLLEAMPATTLEEMEAQGRALLAFGCGAVLIKGGHGDGREAIDVLVTRESVHQFSGPRIETKNTHGTGCTLSAAIAAGLARGLSLVDAVGAAKAFISKAIAAGAHQAIGKGSGPVDHLFNISPIERA